MYHLISIAIWAVVGILGIIGLLCGNPLHLILTSASVYFIAALIREAKTENQ